MPPTKWYCPACDRGPWPTEEELRAHFDRARAAGKKNHMAIEEIEDWDEPDVPDPT